MRSDKAVFCDRVRALKNPLKRFSREKNSDKRSSSAGSRPTRDFLVSYTIYAQAYPQLVRCKPPRNALSCSTAQGETLHIGFSAQTPNHISDLKLKRFIACFRLNQASFSKPKPHLRMAPFFQVGNDRNGTGVAVITVIREGIRLEPWLAAKNFGKDAASLAFFLLIRSCYARRPSVVVLRTRTVSTMMVPKQT